MGSGCSVPRRIGTDVLAFDRRPVGRYGDAFDAYSRAIRINPYVSEVWSHSRACARAAITRFPTPWTYTLSPQSWTLGIQYITGSGCLASRRIGTDFLAFDWCPVGQYGDAFDAYSRAIRINPYISEVWSHSRACARAAITRFPTP